MVILKLLELLIYLHILLIQAALFICGLGIRLLDYKWVIKQGKTSNNDRNSTDTILKCGFWYSRVPIFQEHRASREICILFEIFLKASHTSPISKNRRCALCILAISLFGLSLNALWFSYFFSQRNYAHTPHKKAFVTFSNERTNLTNAQSRSSCS